MKLDKALKAPWRSFSALLALIRDLEAALRRDDTLLRSVGDYGFRFQIASSPSESATSTTGC